jgi:hypothetical protein
MLENWNVPARLELQNHFETLNANVNLELFIKKLKRKRSRYKIKSNSMGYISGISFCIKRYLIKESDVHKKNIMAKY